MRFPAADGYELGGVLFESTSPRKVALVHGGAGIAAARYRHFAAFLAQSGIPVLTYDYRGIGLSRPARLRGFRATVEDWSEYDSAAAVAWLRSRYPGAEMLGIAHSAGALLLGGAHNAGEQARLVLVSGHTGYYGDYRPAYRVPMAALWHGLMPALTALAGYFPARALGLGEDLPRAIALQWAGRWSGEVRPAGKGPAHQRTRLLLDRCAALARPAVLVAVADDAFATPRGTERLLSCYPRLAVERRLELAPADAGVARLGHFGVFARGPGAVLWPRLLAAL